MLERISSEEAQELLEIGYLAVDEGWLEQAEEIFSTLVLCQPENPHPRIGLALVAHSQSRSDDAMRYLEAVINDFPQAVFARSLLAHFMKLANQPGWETLANESLRRKQTGISADMAMSVLGPLAQSAPSDDLGGRLLPHARLV